ncbi:MAG: MarR family transcriptional regulator [Ramlibacter sp.]
MAKTSPFRHEKADDSAGFLLWKITALWQRRLSGVLGESGITQTQYAIMASLRWFEHAGEPITQTHLAEHTRIDKMTLSKAIRKLEEDGLVRREPSGLDSRAVDVRFTPRGHKVVEQAVVAIENADDEFFSGLLARQLADYKALTARLITHNS